MLLSLLLLLAMIVDVVAVDDDGVASGSGIVDVVG